MKNLTIFLVLITSTVTAFGQSPKASVNGSTAYVSEKVHALDDAVISLEVFPNTEGWEWIAPDGSNIGVGSGIFVSEFSMAKQGEYRAVSTTDPNQSDVLFDLIYLEDDFAGSDVSLTACPGALLTLQAELEGLVYSWSNNETTSSIEVDDNDDATYELTISTIFGDSDSANYEVMRSEVDRPNILSSVTHSISCAQEGQLTLTLQDFNRANLPFLGAVHQDGEVYQYVLFRDTTLTIGLPAGSYDAVVIDDYQGCSFSYDGFTIDSFSGTREEFDVAAVTICEGDEYTIEALSGYASYLWEDGSTGQTLTVSPEQSESYSVSLFDANGCGVEVTHPIEVSPSFDVDLTVNQRNNTVLGSIELNLINVSLEAYPISVFVTDSNGDIFLIDQLMNHYSLTQLSDGVYESLTLISNIGCIVELGGFELGALPTYEEIITPIGNVCANSAFLLSAPSGSNSYVWNDGSVGRFLVIFPSQNTTYSALATDLSGNQINYIYNVEVIPAIESEFEVILRGETGLGLVDVILNTYSQEDFPIQVAVTNANGVEETIGTMNSDQAQFEINDGEYFDLTLYTDQGCSVVLGDFTMSQVVDSRIGTRVTGQVWLDVSTNAGVLEEGESGLEGIIVRAINLEGDVKAETVSDVDGTYTLNLESETVFLEFDPVYNLTGTIPNAGTGDEVDSDLDGSNGPGTTDYFNPGTDSDEVNAGFVFGVLSLSWDGVSLIKEDEGHKIIWNVQNEEFISNYSLERSIGSINDFVEIATIDPLYNDQPSNSYNYLSEDISEIGVYYYRVKHIDTDGRYTYSKVVTIDVDVNSIAADFNANLFPMPASDILNIELDNTENQTVHMDIYTLGGKLVLSDRFNNLSNDIITVDINSLTSNVYVMQLTMNNQMVTKKITIE